jgi:hypothetical protein
MERTTVGGRFGSKRNGHRRKENKSDRCAMVLGKAKAIWPSEACFDTMKIPTWIFPEAEA